MQICSKILNPTTLWVITLHHATWSMSIVYKATSQHNALYGSIFAAQPHTWGALRAHAQP